MSLGSLIDTISGVSTPTGIAITPDGKKAYVANAITPNTVTVLDLDTNTVVSTIPVSILPEFMAMRYDGAFAYVTGGASTHSSSYVYAIDTTTDQVVATIPVGTVPSAMIAGQADTRLFISNFVDGTVSVIRMADNTLEYTIPVGNSPTNLAATPDGNYVFVHTNNRSISVIDTSTYEVASSFTLTDYPTAMAVTQDSSQLLIATIGSSGSSKLSAMDIATQTSSWSVSFANSTTPSSIAIDPTGSATYVLVSGSPYPSIQVVDLAAQLIVGSVTGFFQSTVMALNPAGNRAYLLSAQRSGANDNAVFVVALSGAHAYPTAPVGQNLSMPIGGNATQTFTTTDTITSPIQWAISNTPNPTGASTTLTFTDSTSAILGTASVLPSVNSDRSASLEFQSTENWAGSRDIYIAAKEISSGTWSPWTKVTVSVVPPVGPTAPFIVQTGSTSQLPQIAENSSVSFDLEWNDPDYTPTGAGSWRLDIGLTGSGGTFLSSTAYVSDGSSGGAVELQIPIPNPTPLMDNPAYATVLVIPSDDSSKVKRHVTVTPPSFFNGSFSFYAVAVNTTHAKFPVFGARSVFTAEVGNAVTAPGAPFPSTMPSVEPNYAGLSPKHRAMQIFSTFDPSPLSQDIFTATLHDPTRGTLTVTPYSATQVQIAFVPADGVTGPYSFTLTAANSAGTSASTTVTGVIASSRVTVVLQTVDHNATPTDPNSVTQLCVLSEISNLKVTDALAGSGQVQLSVSAQELARRSQALGGDFSNPLNLVEPGAVEVVVYIGDQCIALGPITASTYNSSEATFDLTAMSLLEELLTHRAIEYPGLVQATPDATWADPNSLVYQNIFLGSVPGQHTGIFEDLLNREQAKLGGNLSLGFESDMIDVKGIARDHQTTVKFELNSLLSAAFKQIGTQAVGGAEFWVDPQTRQLKIAVNRGTNHIGELIFTERNSAQVNITSKWDALSTVVRVEGAGGYLMGPAAAPGQKPTDATFIYGYSPRPNNYSTLTTEAAKQTANNTAANFDASVVSMLSKYGRHVNPFTASTLTQIDSLNQVADGYYNDNNLPLITADIIYDAGPGRPYGVLDFGVGDFATVEVQTQLGLITFPCRITASTISLADGTSDQFQVEVQVEAVQMDSDGYPISREARTTHSPELLSMLYDAIFKQK